MQTLVFLGGTIANNNWRKEVLETMTSSTGANLSADIFFNPVVSEWNEEAQQKEEQAKKNASHLVFYLGAPYQEGNPLSTYSLVEATMALYDEPNKAVVIFDPTGIEGHALKAYKQAEKVLRQRFPEANIFSSLKEACAAMIEDLKHSSWVSTQRSLIHKMFFAKHSDQFEEDGYTTNQWDKLYIFYFNRITQVMIKAYLVEDNSKLVTEIV